MSARAIWKGTLSVGLVTIPVKAYKATDEANADIAFRQLHCSCSTPVNRKEFCSKCNADVPFSDIVKGFDNGDGTFTTVTKEELDAIKPESGEAIVLDSFVPVADIDAIYVESTYYVTPDGGAASTPYAVIQAAMNKLKFAGQGRLAIYGRERNITVRAIGTGLALQLMRTVNEVRAMDELPGYVAPNAVKIDPAMLKLGEQVINSLIGSFDATEYVDDYASDVKALIESKRTGKPTTAKAAAAKPLASDLMSALRASLDTKVTKAKTVKADAKALGPKRTKKAS